MRTTAWISLAAGLLLSCGRADELRYEERFDPGSFQVVGIAYLKSLCRGDGITLREPAVIEGRVTANDHYGEFYKCIWVEDASGGIEIELDETALYRRYSLGAPLRIFCEGLALGNYGGRILLGAPPSEERPVDPIPAEEFALRLHLLAESFEPLPPEELSLEELAPSRTGRFVQFRNVRFAEEEAGLGWCDSDPETGRSIATIRHLCDDAGNRLAVYTPGTCLYATEPLPSGKGSVCGILDRFNGTYQLRVVNRDWTPDR